MGRGGEVLGFGFSYLWWKWIQNLLALEPTLMVMPAPFSFNFNTWCIITGVLTAQVPWKCFSVVKLCMQYFYFGNCSLKEVAVQKWPEKYISFTDKHVVFLFVLGCCPVCTEGNGPLLLLLVSVLRSRKPSNSSGFCETLLFPWGVNNFVGWESHLWSYLRSRKFAEKRVII